MTLWLAFYYSLNCVTGQWSPFFSLSNWSTNDRVSVVHSQVSKLKQSSVFCRVSLSFFSCIITQLKLLVTAIKKEGRSQSLFLFEFPLHLIALFSLRIILLPRLALAFLLFGNCVCTPFEVVDLFWDCNYSFHARHLSPFHFFINYWLLYSLSLHRAKYLGGLRTKAYFFVLSFALFFSLSLRFSKVKRLSSRAQTLLLRKQQKQQQQQHE